ncbi:hypothetical protein ACP_2955 [Acidobacterium capsulatum ATCC 51196]|uniref:Uncharacterized protein n=1 Tax=Acidobacterium capsulatum (strain ATCC 51196 / DSM 11244 / BCRC 80197 / JCM 7670 / NBRC 15755 / NCIMB 13165 / 161) TaxID=240015 RepID=C1F4B4_ACIC5|nr:hypothetical protein ACP_2955 [Acidobacterium capsulatum ATCC 51196]
MFCPIASNRAAAGDGRKLAALIHHFQFENHSLIFKASRHRVGATAEFRQLEVRAAAQMQPGSQQHTVNIDTMRTQKLALNGG